MSRNFKFLVCCSLAAVALAIAAASYLPALQAPVESAIFPVGKPLQIQSPLGLPPVPIPADNPLTAETIALGRRLYYDPHFPSDSTIPCPPCTRRNLHFPTIGPSLGVCAASLARAKRPRSSIRPLVRCNSGMAALRALKNRPKVPWPIPSKWPTLSRAS